MSDTRFTTVVNEVQDLLDVLDIDTLGDIKNILMLALRRPVTAEAGRDSFDECATLNLVLWGNEFDHGTECEFPLNMLQLTRLASESALGLGPYIEHETQAAVMPPDIESLDDEELAAVLQQALGVVRIASLLDAD